MDVIARNSCVPFTTKDGSTIRELLAYRNSSIRNQSLAEAIVPPGMTTEWHHHKRSEEIYYILKGKGKMHLSDEWREVGAGDAIAIPPETWHQITNNSTEDLVFLCCCAPGYEHSDTYFSP